MGAFLGYSWVKVRYHLLDYRRWRRVTAVPDQGVRQFAAPAPATRHWQSRPWHISWLSGRTIGQWCPRPAAPPCGIADRIRGVVC
ncbi:protein of unknown function [Cupriavidus taiwanensis]|uniref:Uncharacterized protein n=1 Tax=Cupriavidus taiwanensis TaxID=164546 RepID=A0A375IBK4_9BURK|nr:protein of unknown function [Cupriavidus taiwanensis]